LTEECFKTKKVDSPSREALKPKDVASLLGMETSQYVAENVELRRAYFVPARYQVGGDTGKGMMSISQGATSLDLGYGQLLGFLPVINNQL
jgi:hypothetical protein